AGLQPKSAYDPSARFELKVTEVEFLRTPRERQLMARVYQPQGAGPFPTVLDLHGGAWRRKDRFAEEPMDRAIATSGVLVVAIDLRLSEEAPYPASMQGALDDNVLPAVQEKFVATYKAAGGVCELTVFEDSEHEWVAKPGPQTDRAREMVKAFIARQLKT